MLHSLHCLHSQTNFPYHLQNHHSVSALSQLPLVAFLVYRHLTKDKLKSVNRIIKLEDTEITGTLAFQISLGQLGENELAAHAVEISDISLTKVESGTTEGEETDTDQIITPPENKEEESNLEETNTQDKQLDSEEEESNSETDTTSEYPLT